MIRKKNELKQRANAIAEPAERLLEERASRRQETRLELPVGPPDLEALQSVTREWLVPLLVEEFLRKHGIDSEADSNGPDRSQTNWLDGADDRKRTQERTTDPLDRGGRG